MALKNKIVFWFCLVLVMPHCLTAQDSLEFRPGQKYRLHLSNGETLSGFVVHESAEFITLEKRPELTRTEVKKNAIVQVEKVGMREFPEEDLLGENPHADRYLLSSSAMPFEAGRLSSVAHWFVLDQVEYAFTDNFAVNAGSVAFYPTSVGLRLAFEVGEHNYVGASFGGFADLGNGGRSSDLLGYVAQAKYTHGTSNRNFTLGFGFIGLNSEMVNVNTSELFTSTVLLSGGFCNRFSDRWALALDGHFLPDESVMIGGAGLKFLRDESTCWTFGAYSFVNDLGAGNMFTIRSLSFPLPYFSYARKFD